MGAELTVTAGRLRHAVEEADANSATSLTLKGSLDMADFEYLALEMNRLQTLDLSGVTLEAYDGEATATGRTSCEADALPECALLGMRLMSLKLPQNLKEIKAGALAALHIRELSIPATVTKIGDRALADCLYLTTIEIPASVRTIGEGAFKGCAALHTVVLHNTPTAIGDNTFAGCRTLININIPESVKKIGTAAFSGCTILKNIGFPAHLTHIGDRAFYSSGLTTADLSGCTSLTSIGAWAFAGNTRLLTVQFPPHLSEIGTGAFFNSSTLTSARVPAGVTGIDDFTFDGIAGDGNLLGESSVKQIGRYALADWKTVKAFVLPATLEEMKEGAMADWGAVDTIRADRLTVVPALEPGIWGSLDKTNVFLRVNPEMKDHFADTAQWQDFKITTEGPDLSTVMNSVTGTSRVEARFDGLLLYLSAPEEIAAVRFYDVAGRRFTLPSDWTGTTRCIDTSAWDTPVMIVHVTLTSGKTAVLKLAR